MEIVKNKYVNLLIFAAVTVIAVVSAMSFMTFKNTDTTKTDAYKAHLDLKK